MLRTWLARIRGLIFRRRLEEEFTEEVQTHLAMMSAEFESQGMNPAEARRAALRSFGGVEPIREEHREARGLMHLERLVADVAFAVRMMGRNPGFTAVAVLTLALGIGVNAMLFSAYDAVALKPLPVADPNGVYRLERWFERGMRGNVQYAFSLPEFAYLREHGRSFGELIAASWPMGVFAEWPGQSAPERLHGQLVSANYFRALGVQPRLGAGFGAEGSAGPVIVLSDSYWRRRMNADRGVTGRQVKLNGAVFTVVGVAPGEFTGTAQSFDTPDFWAPVSMQAALVPGDAWMRSPNRPMLQILARVKPGITLGAARAESAVLVRQFGAGPMFGRGQVEKTSDVTLQHVVFWDNTEDPRFLASVAGTMLAVGLVLAVACANLANMMLARGASRRHEIGVRLALGAGRARVVRQLLTESVVLALAGGLAGLGLANWTGRLLLVWVRQQIAGHFGVSGDFLYSQTFSPDWRVLVYALAVSVAAGVVFGLSPALRLTRVQLGREGRKSRLRSVLIGVQVAVSMMLLITGGLLARGLARSRVASPGFDTRSLYVLGADFGENAAKAEERQRRVLERLRMLPQVAGVTEGNVPLLGTWTPPIAAGGSQGRTLASYAAETYLDTVGIPLVRGRNFLPREIAANAPVALISDAAARRFWGAEDALGRRFQLDMDFRGTMAEFTVIGVVKDVRFGNVTRLDPAHVYLTPRKTELQNALVRIQGDSRTAVAAIRGAVQAADPELMPSLFLQNLEDGPVWLQKMGSRAAALATLTLAGLALLLAGVGIYGVMAFLVSQQTREIGIRMALGAAAGEVVRGVVISGLRPVFVGIAAGIAGAAGLSAVVHSTLQAPGAMDLLYGVSFYDPATFGGLAAFLLIVAALASAGPARKAARVDPAVALRWE